MPIRINIKELVFAPRDTIQPELDYVPGHNQSVDYIRNYLFKDLLHHRFGVACSDETSDLSTGVVKVFYFPAAFFINELIGTLSSPAVGADFKLSVSVNGSNLLTTALVIKENENISDAPDFTVDQDVPTSTRVEITITQIGSTNAGIGLTLWFGGYWKA